MLLRQAQVAVHGLRLRLVAQLHILHIDGDQFRADRVRKRRRAPNDVGIGG